MNQDTYIIHDLEAFTKYARSIVYKNFNKYDSKELIDIEFEIDANEQEDFDTVISQQESLGIVKEFSRKQINRKTKLIRYIIDYHKFLKIIESIHERMIANILNSLVNKNLLEVAFDPEVNDFVFWSKDKDENKNKEKPDTD